MQVCCGPRIGPHALSIPFTPGRRSQPEPTPEQQKWHLFLVPPHLAASPFLLAWLQCENRFLWEYSVFLHVWYAALGIRSPVFLVLPSPETYSRVTPSSSSSKIRPAGTDTWLGQQNLSWSKVSHLQALFPFHGELGRLMLWWFCWKRVKLAGPCVPTVSRSPSWFSRNV